MFDCHLAINVYPLIGKHFLEASLRKPFQKQDMLHDGYRGMEVRLTYDLMSDQYTLLSDTDTKGSVENFLMIKSTKPTLALTKD